jgi:NACalpha-BTF3-like transcription factor
MLANPRVPDALKLAALKQLTPQERDPFTLSPGQVRYGPDGRPIAEVPAAPEAYTLSPGSSRFVGGQQVASVPDKPEPPPSAVREYEYAREQGFKGTFQDWEASKKGGMSLQVDPETGAVIFQQGGNIRPMTEAQSKDTVYATRAQGSLETLDKLGDALTSLGESAAGSLGKTGNYLKSEEYQQAEQAGREFLAAVLRKDTGAAVTQQEMDIYGSTYLPEPGNGPKVLEQKRVSRRRALEALKAGMPAQAILAQENALRRTEAAAGTAAPATAQSDLPEGVTEEDIEFTMKKHGLTREEVLERLR